MKNIELSGNRIDAVLTLSFLSKIFFIQSKSIFLKNKNKPLRRWFSSWLNLSLLITLRYICVFRWLARKKLGKKSQRATRYRWEGAVRWAWKIEIFQRRLVHWIPLHSDHLYTIHNCNVTPSNDSYRINSHFRISE